MEGPLRYQGSTKKTRALGIEVGDFVSFDPRTITTQVTARFLDK